MVLKPPHLVIALKNANMRWSLACSREVIGLGATSGRCRPDASGSDRTWSGGAFGWLCSVSGRRCRGVSVRGSGRDGAESGPPLDAPGRDLSIGTELVDCWRSMARVLRWVHVVIIR
jgi:hypothetical protein